MNQEKSTTAAEAAPPVELDPWTQLKPGLSRLDLSAFLENRIRRSRGLSYVLAQGAIGRHGASLEADEVHEFAWALWTLSEEILNVLKRLDEQL
ncbi:hypothetical protein [Endothiovibrio diazotrophicus]